MIFSLVSRPEIFCWVFAGRRVAFGLVGRGWDAIFAYIDGWYNTRRIQKDLGNLSPAEYETAWRQAHIDQSDSAYITATPTGAR